jgi:hypothetical protein
MGRATTRLALFAAMVLGAASSACAAPAFFTARITNLLFWDQGDLVYIYVEGGTQGRPACAGSNGDYISFAMSRPRAKEYIAGLMMAFAAGKTVTFRTEGACIDQSVSDTLTYFTINDQ